MRAVVELLTSRCPETRIDLGSLLIPAYLMLYETRVVMEISNFNHRFFFVYCFLLLLSACFYISVFYLFYVLIFVI